MRSVHPAIRRYVRRLLAVMLVYVVTLVAVIRWFSTAPPHGLLAYVAAVLPALPIIGVFVVIGRLLVEMTDEYVRMLLVRQALIATAFALTVTTTWGFLERFGLAGHAEGFWAAVLWFSGLGVGGLVNWYLESRAA